jgi:hypothetical protein
MNTDTPAQLPLLVEADVPLQLRLDRRTREIGLAHIARLKAMLAEQAARRQADNAA